VEPSSTGDTRLQGAPDAKLEITVFKGTKAAASALPATEKVNPAAPNAGTAALVTRFFFEACFTRGMVASSNSLQEGSS